MLTRMPALTRMAEGGVVVKDCQSTSSCTAISVASILTGVPPQVHGITTLVGAALDDDVTPLAACFRRAGYMTGFFPSSAVLNRTTRLGEAFHHVDDEFLQPLYHELGEGADLDLPLFRRHFYQPPAARTVPGSLRFCEVTTEAVVRWMARTPDPWFAVVHYIEPHYPYWPPPGWRVSDDPLDRQNYHASLRYLDAVCLDRLTDVVQRRGSETLIVLTSDHGEYWGTHGFRPTGDHGDLYQDVLSVPLVFWGHGASRLRFAQQAPWSHLDVAPTILGIAGLARPDRLAGVDRTSSDEEQPRPSWEDVVFNDPTYVKTMGGFRRGGVAVRFGRHKLIRRAPGLGEMELYDLQVDPHECRNLIGFSPRAERELGGLLPPLLTRGHRPLPDVSRRLAALGYL